MKINITFYVKYGAGRADFGFVPLLIPCNLEKFAQTIDDLDAVIPVLEVKSGGYSSVIEALSEAGVSGRKS
jgi:hypothetical protein